jgi:hypothetical protein
MNTDRTDVFFYGLYMDSRVLREHAVQPVEPRHACAHGHALRIGRRATLVVSEGERAHGMVYALTTADLARLYDAPGLEDYRPVPLRVRTDDGAELPVTCYVLPEAPPPGEADAVYADRLRTVLAQHGFPTDGVPTP